MARKIATIIVLAAVLGLIAWGIGRLVHPAQKEGAAGTLIH